MIPSLREPPFFLGDLGERLPRKDEIRPPPAAEEVAPGVWRGSDGKLFTQLETPKEPLLDPYEELAKELMAKTPLEREPQVGDTIAGVPLVENKIHHINLVGTVVPPNFEEETAILALFGRRYVPTSDSWFTHLSPGREWEFVS